MKIVQLTSFPAKRPVHGGQIRAHHTALALRAAGHEVKRLPFFATTYYKDLCEAPIVDLAPAAHTRRHPHMGEIADLTLSALVATDEDIFADFAASLDEARPGIVMLEEPWLWPALRRWMDGRINPPLVILNAYNVETQAKAAMLADKDYANTASVVAEIEALERDLVCHASGITVTTEEDAEVFRGWTDRPITVARNGTQARALSHLHGVLPDSMRPGQLYLLFVGSAHPPNMAGFFSMAMPALPVLRSNERIVLAGGVCHLIAAKLAERGPNAIVRDRTVFLGQVSGLALECLLSNAAGILLPITYGGGSNLKTAEALSSGLPIIGTSIAFRGFEDFRHLPQVTIADTPAEFARAIQHRLHATPAPRQQSMVTALHWETTLQPIVALVKALTDDLARVA